MKLKAHRVGPTDGLNIVPASPQRQWMNDIIHPYKAGTDPKDIKKGFANRCLPLLMANQMGWDIVTTCSYLIVTLPDGKHAMVPFDRPEGPPPSAPVNNFHANIVTWPVPWVFETPPGWDLMIMPPPNVQLPDGVTCLSAIVETDHSHQSFTLNWMVESLRAVFLWSGTPIARIVPVQTELLEGWDLQVDDDVPEGFPEFLERRNESRDTEGEHYGRWDKDYWNAAKRKKIKRGNDEAGCPMQP